MTDRYLALFTERFNAAGLPGRVHEAKLTGIGRHSVLRVSVSLTDEWDWTARYDVLKQASDFQAGSGVPVVCEFKPAEVASGNGADEQGPGMSDARRQTSRSRSAELEGVGHSAMQTRPGSARSDLYSAPARTRPDPPRGLRALTAS